MTENEIIGRNLKALREANGYTQEQLANFLGVKRTAYKNYELGDREAPIALLERCAELLGCELDLLFEENVNDVKDMLVCAFRADSLCDSDLNEIANFKKIVRNYIKMEKLLNE